MDNIEWSSLLTEGRIEKFKRVAKKRTRRVSVVLENIYDSHNVNAVLRSCDGFGIQDVYIIMPEGFTFRYNPGITMKSHRWLNIYFFNEVRECVNILRRKGFLIFSSFKKEDSIPHFKLDSCKKKLALVFGNEKSGVSREMLNYSDGYFWIPMFGFSESLNVSVAAAITISRIRERMEKVDGNFNISKEEQEELVKTWILKDTEKYRVGKYK